MIDTLHYCLKKLERDNDRSGRKKRQDPYAVVTMHRPSDVDEKEKLKDILSALAEISRDMPVYFPIHPRTQKNMEAFGLSNIVAASHIETMPPQSYLEFLTLWKDSALVLTDSGGIQEETTALGIPCFTMRDNTERPVTVEEGTNILVGTIGKGILESYDRFKKGEKKKGKIPALWDGKSSERIVGILADHFRGPV